MYVPLLDAPRNRTSTSPFLFLMPFLSTPRRVLGAPTGNSPAGTWNKDGYAYVHRTMVRLLRQSVWKNLALLALAQGLASEEHRRYWRAVQVLRKLQASMERFRKEQQTKGFQAQHFFHKRSTCGFVPSLMSCMGALQLCSFKVSLISISTISNSTICIVKDGKHGRRQLSKSVMSDLHVRSFCTWRCSKTLNLIFWHFLGSKGLWIGNLKTVEDEKLKIKHGMIEVVFVQRKCRSRKIESTTIRFCKLKTFKPTIQINVFLKPTETTQF